MRFYVRNDTFFQSLPLVLQRHPQSRFLCPAMAGERQAEGWVRRLGLNERVELLPRQSRERMAQLFRQSAIAVSITEHDGTPNTLLEAMACGCFPIAGDIESLREWIEPGVNGLLVLPGDPQTLAQAIIQAWEDNELRRQAREHNLKIIAHRAEYGQVMTRAEAFYHQLVGRTPPV
jgi:glycosyltransferase involved in cell wall biosynthesis